MSTARIEEMQRRLTPLAPLHIEIIDDSALHAGHAGARGGGGHFRLNIVSAQFAGKATLARHRMIYAALGDMMQNDIHALAIRATTADEATTKTTKEES